jgi:hypothetical protein
MIHLSLIGVAQVIEHTVNSSPQGMLLIFLGNQISYSKNNSTIGELF